MEGSLRILKNVIYTACEKGADLYTLCGALGIHPRDIGDSERRIEGVAPMIRFWTEAVAQTGDMALGLHAGMGSNPSTFGLLGYLMQSCRTLKDACQAVIQYQQTISGWVSYAFQIGKSCELIFLPNPEWWQVSPATARHPVELAMSGGLNYIRIFTGQHMLPVRAELSYSENVLKAEYERIWGCPVYFGKSQNKLVFGEAFADMPLISHNESLHVSFTHILEEKVAELGKSETMGDLIRKTIMADFHGKVPSLEIIAAHMNVSERSLQRKLQQEGESYRSISARIRQELAMNLLKNSDAKVLAISELLGYTEPSAFHRAFKNWTKTSPVKQKSQLTRKPAAN
ncbi:AraC-type DNA-binding protein [Dyadobacter sp. SG02]|uniref:AraC family transcriptional regulator n=1 Tax=Dyadobacter sp. SG02 TaxID=1855291 RepID=UPI0008C6832F|nr:AraC family transcriptional regulator [Dyadobacter sp. SG02]SEJ73072.1 AraC-type DNA-binding protein [Dyadobacter sp. SG02]